VLNLFFVGSFASCLGSVFFFGRGCRLFIYVSKVQLQRDKEGNRGV
jgi:hypothetical protein